MEKADLLRERPAEKILLYWKLYLRNYIGSHLEIMFGLGLLLY